MKTAALSLLGLIAAGRLLAQGALLPSGAPAPTMKTLDQIEPRTPIDAIHTPGDASNSYIISAPGSYYLTGNLTGNASKNGILVQADNVTIDLGGFTLQGVPGSADGITVDPSKRRITVRNGTITGWGGDGVDEVGAVETTYEGIRSSDNTGDGLLLGMRTTVRQCELHTNGGYGVSVANHGTITDSRAHGNGLGGFYFGAGLARGCVASNNGGNGIEAFSEPSLISGCVAFENGNDGIHVSDGGKIDDCIARDNSAGIYGGSYGVVRNCTGKNNGWGVMVTGSTRVIGNTVEGNGVGLVAFGDHNVIDGNLALNGGTGIEVPFPAQHNLIIRNSVTNHPTPYSVATDNRYGPVVNITANGTAPVLGSSANSTLTTADPHANFTY